MNKEENFILAFQINNDELLDARTTSSRHIILSSARIGILISRLSVTASMIKSLSEKS